jgi:hypothetical protein
MNHCQALLPVIIRRTVSLTVDDDQWLHIQANDGRQELKVKRRRASTTSTAVKKVIYG